jgi:hypothetical protein
MDAPHARRNRRALTSLLLAAGLAVGGCSTPAADGPAAALAPEALSIQLDGDLSDWAGVDPLQEDLSDPADETRIDLRALHAWDDPAWLYLSLEVGDQLNLQGMPGTVYLLIDVDANPATGATMWGVDGVELEYVLSRRIPRSGSDSLPEYGGGFEVYLRSDDVTRYEFGSPPPPFIVTLEQAGIAALPTHSADRFEVRLRRDLSELPGSPVLGDQIRIALVAESSPRRESTAGGASGSEPDTEGASGGKEAEDDTREILLPALYTFRSTPGPDPVPPTLAGFDPPTDPATFRVATWNVGEGSFRSPGDHARILAAVRPDVILLDEVYDGISDEELADFFASPGLAALGEWSWTVSVGGGRQKTLVAARGRAVRPLLTMREVAYAPGALEALKVQVPEPFHRALDYEARVNMSATGAAVEVVPGASVVFVPVDLQSAGYDGSPQDVLRLLQAQTLGRHIRGLVETRGSFDPAGTYRLVVAGDLNLVGSRAPLDVLLNGRGSPFGALVTAHLPRLDDGTPITWRGRHPNPFAPGRLDYTLYSGETLEQVGGFTFSTDFLTERQLAEVGLERPTSASTSDHLVMVTDLRLRNP